MLLWHASHPAVVEMCLCGLPTASLPLWHAAHGPLAAAWSNDWAPAEGRRPEGLDGPRPGVNGRAADGAIGLPNGEGEVVGKGPPRPTGPDWIPKRVDRAERKFGAAARAGTKLLAVVVHVPALSLAPSQELVEWQQPQSAVVFG